jgi:hypothetical protein
MTNRIYLNNFGKWFLKILYLVVDIEISKQVLREILQVIP